MVHRGQVPPASREEYTIASRNYAFREDTRHFFAKDSDQPYIQEKPFDWIHGYQVGGRTTPKEIHFQQERAQCQHRTLGLSIRTPGK
ncbi:hypothetical protein GCM10027185_35310 [Spirosoma pulveris]